MRPSALEELLRRADAATGGPGDPGEGFAAGVYRAARRRARMRRAAWGAGAAAGLIVVAAAAWLSGWHANGPRPVAPPGPAARGREAGASSDELAALRAEIEWRQQLVQTLRDGQRQAARIEALRQELVRPDPLQEVRREVERVAFARAQQAELLYRVQGRVREAAECYRELVRTHPGTHWAELARQRLAEIEQSGQGHTTGKDDNHEDTRLGSGLLCRGGGGSVQHGLRSG